jgi:arylsulfatase A-like enzyme
MVPDRSPSGAKPRALTHHIPPARWTLFLAATLVLLTGLGQNFARTAATLVGRRWDHGIHVWWMAPIGDALVYAGVLVLLGVTWLLVPRLRTKRVAATVLLAPALLTLALLIPGLHPWAGLALAAGIAVQGGRLIARHGASERTVQVSAAVMTVVTAGVAGGALLWADITRRPPERPAAAADAPNVLLLLWDTARASAFSLYGADETSTPNLERLASEGVTFDRAISTASYTLPSHASLFTGRWAHELSVSWRVPLEGEPATIAETLRSAGYRTAAFSANRIYVTQAWGLARGFDLFEEHRLGFQQVVRSSTLARAIANTITARDVLGFNDDLARVHAPDHAEKLLEWLEETDQDRPFFAFVNYMEAHAPYLPSSPYDTLFGWYDGSDDDERRAARRVARHETGDMPPEQAMSLLPAYKGAIAELDAAVATLLAELERRGALQNTIIIVTADHGEEFGEHGVFGHGNSLYLESLRVPLVLWYPARLPAAKRVAATASLRNIPATILDLVGAPASLPGHTLRPFWEGDVADTAVALSLIRAHPGLPPWSLSRTGDVSSVVGESRQVIRNASGALEVFDLNADARGTARIEPDDAAFRIAERLPPRKP